MDQRAFIQGQVSGGLGFFAFLFLGLCLVFRSIPRAFAVSIVPVTGFLASIGIMGILGWRLSAVHAIALATIAGTGVDNAIVLAMRGWTREARDAAIDTTLLIVLSMATVLLCSSYLVVQTAFVCMAGLVASAATAILVLPALGKRDG
jgi:predicted RND superfamily exporter protein